MRVYCCKYRSLEKLSVYIFYELTERERERERAVFLIRSTQIDLMAIDYLLQQQQQQQKSIINAWDFLNYKY